MAGGRITARIRRSKLHTFGCFRTITTEFEGPHPIQGPGYSRTVHCNEPLMHKKKPLKYCSNYISTTSITLRPSCLKHSSNSSDA
ncbi:hypothetical protein MLD38_029482 [Melastoma candidum]|uniref:Uncharacterized protein n=1 Tax=Melastoma candidum TaxID=119954 RepID=A0ACB9N4A1_9MYRT|nr:hypothetical protein MLD38_029482 [Melastoma candidum]